MDIRKHVQETIDRLKAERDEFIANFNSHPYVIETNRQLAAQNGAIQVLEELLYLEAEKPVNGKVEADELEKVFGG